MLKFLFMLLAIGVVDAETAARARAMVAAMRSIPIPALLEDAKQRKADDVVALLETARDAFGLQQVSVLDGGSDKASMQHLKADALAWTISAAIRDRASWDAPLSPAGYAALRKHRTALANAFAKLPAFHSRLEWVLYHLGEKAEAKKNLLAIYEKRTAEVMAMERADHGLNGDTPLSESEYQLRALRALSTKDELQPLEAKMQKMKVHLSNLPESHIVT